MRRMMLSTVLLSGLMCDVINTVIIEFIAKYPTGPLLKAFLKVEIVKFIVFLITYHRLYNYLFVCLVF